MFSKFLNMRMSLLPPNMSDCLAGHRFEYKSIVILTLQKLNSLLLKYRIVKENYGIEMAFFLFYFIFSVLPGLLPGWCLLVSIFYFILIIVKTYFRLLFFTKFACVQGVFFDLKPQLSLALVNLPSFLFSLFLLLSSAESFLPQMLLEFLL